MFRYVTVVSCLYIFSYGSGVEVPPKLKLNDGRDIPAIALGTWLGNNTKVSGDKTMVQPGRDEVEQAVRWAVQAGYRHIDTAFAYKIEDQVGRGLAWAAAQGVPREELFVTTKLWNAYHAREAVEPALRQSLASLQLDYVDLYLIHWPVGQFDNKTYDYTDYLDTWRGMMEVKSKGLARSIGLSNFNEQMMDRILENGLEKPAVLQVEINLNLQQPELLRYCRQQDIVVMAYTPFGSLSPSKAKEDAPPPRLDHPDLVKIANKYSKNVPQIVLRYLVELGVIPIPKSLSQSHIKQNIDIFDFSLTEDEKTILRSFDRNYRTIPQYKWSDHPYYPFEKKQPQ